MDVRDINGSRKYEFMRKPRSTRINYLSTHKLNSNKAKELFKLDEYIQEKNDSSEKIYLKPKYDIKNAARIQSENLNMYYNNRLKVMPRTKSMGTKTNLESYPMNPGNFLASECPQKMFYLV